MLISFAYARPGLKLQGDIGKFGNVELSDVAAYVEVPNGKIIAGTETGTLLLWDGNLIQVCIEDFFNQSRFVETCL